MSSQSEEVNLNTLLLALFGKSEEEIKKIGQELYAIELLAQEKWFKKHQTHDRQAVMFRKERFSHAFFKSPDKNVIDRARVERIKWILPIVQGKAQNWECWELTYSDGKTKRLYACYGLGYVVWLEQEEDWIFSTAYSCSKSEIRKYINQALQQKRIK